MLIRFHTIPAGRTACVAQGGVLCLGVFCLGGTPHWLIYCLAITVFIKVLACETMSHLQGGVFHGKGDFIIYPSLYF